MARIRFKKSGKKKIGQALLRKGLQIEREAKQRCPVDTGRLRASYTTTLIEQRGQPVVLVGSAVEYAPYVEFGTADMEAQPHLRPAVDAVAAR